MKLLLLIPLFIYIWLNLVNPTIMWQSFDINLFGVKTITMPYIFVNVLFIVFYTLVIFIAFEWWIWLLKNKIKKLEKQLILTKAQLYDGQSKLLEEIKNFFESKLTEKEYRLEQQIEKITKQEQEILKNYNEKFTNILQEIQNENKQVIEKIQQETKKTLQKLDLVDDSILEKFRQLVKR